MSAQITADEMFESLTGFEEIAVEQQFHTDVETLSQGKYLRLIRAMVFVQFKRSGDKDKAAYDKAMNLTVKEAMAMFADAEDMEVSLESGEGEPPVE